MVLFNYSVEFVYKIFSSLTQIYLSLSRVRDEAIAQSISATIAQDATNHTRYLRQGNDDKIAVLTVATQAVGAFLIVAGVVAFSILLRPLVQAQIAASRQYQPL